MKINNRIILKKLIPKLIGISFALMLLLSLFVLTGAAENTQPLDKINTNEKISLPLASKIAEASATDKINIIIILTNQHKDFNTPTGRSKIDVEQKKILDKLLSTKSNDKVLGIKPLKIVNAIAAEVTPDLIVSLSNRSDVSKIELDDIVHIVDNNTELNTETISSPMSDSTSSTIAWGVDKIGAPLVWQRGITGKGVIVAVVDSGVDATHPDLAHLPDSTNTKVIDWIDYVNGRSSPYDDNGHGTHVSGTISGIGTNGYQTGVAPGSNLIEAKVFNAFGAGSMSDVILGFEWAVNNGARVISYSGGGRHNAAYTIALDNAVAAGVIPVVAAGNSGSGDSTISCPGDEINSTAVGATNSSDIIASFSSRGPINFNEMTYIKPNVSAPGVSITSTLPGGKYASWNGTSMATPHVSGTVALMLEKTPSLRPAQINQILESTAVDLGQVGKDNTYGAGRTDAYKAVFTDLVLPKANFTSNVTNGPVPLLVQFTDQSSNATYWNWDFGDRTNSMEQNPIHTYIAEGTYTVTLTVNNENGSDLKSMTISVTNPNKVVYYSGELSGNSVIDLSGNNNNGIATNAIQMTNQTSGANYVSLNGVNSKIDINNNPLTNVSSPLSIEFIGSINTFSKYGALVSKYDGGNNGWYLSCSATSSYNKVRFGAGLNSGSPKFIESNLNLVAGQVYDIVVTYDNNNTHIYINGIDSGSDTWDSPIARSTNNITIGHGSGLNYSNCNMYTFRLYNRSLSSAEVLQNYYNDRWRYVTQPILPKANFSSNVTQGSVPLDVKFTDISKNATHLEWNFGDGSSSVSVANPEHIFTSIGLFNVVLTASNVNGSDSKSMTINVTSIPAPAEKYTFVDKWHGNSYGLFNSPQGIAVDFSGNVYVADMGNNRIKKFNSSGFFLSSFGSAGSGDGQFSSPYSVTVDSLGNFYVADMGNNRIQKFNSNGTFLTKWGSYGNNDGQFNSPHSLVVDSSGNVYVVDFNNNRIQKFDSNGTFLTKWGSGGSGDGQFYYPSYIAVDSQGNIYVDDFGNYRIQKYDSNGKFITQWGSQGTDNGQFGDLNGVAVDSSGNIYVADGVNSCIQKFSSDGTFIAKWGSMGGGDGQVSAPQGVAVDSMGFVYVADSGNNRIQKFNNNGTFLTKWGHHSDSDDEDFLGLYDVATDSLDNLYVADTGNNRILKFSSDGAYYTQWGSYGSAEGQFYYPNSIDVDPSGNVYVADTGNARIQKFSGDGTFLAKWNSRGSGDGQFYWPCGIAIDPLGNVYIVDRDNARIQKFDSNGNFITKWGSQGSGDGQFFKPRGVAVDSSGNVYVADFFNFRIQKFDRDGKFLTKWGLVGSGDGQFNGPSGVAIDSYDNVYVTDSNDNRIQKFNSNGTFITQWGSYGSEDGQFKNPMGIDVNSMGNVYVADTGNNRIQIFAKNPNILPIANFSSNATQGYVPLSVQFTYLSTNATRWNWDFGDGNTSIEQSPMHTYYTVGNYTVNLIVSNANGTSLKKDSINVYSSLQPLFPIANFSSNVTQGYAPFFVQFNDSSLNATSLYWNFGDGTNSTQQNPTHTFFVAGNYTVNLTAANTNGTSSKLAIIYVSSQPIFSVVNFTSNVTFGYAPLSVQFIDQSANVSSWNWNFGDGTASTEQNPIHTYTAAGNYTVNLTASNGNRTDSKLANISVSEKTSPIIPVANFTTNVTSGYAPLSVQFTDQSANASSWNWDFGDGSTSTLQSPVHTYATAGNFTVNLTVSNAKGTASRIATINVSNSSNVLAAVFSASVNSGSAPLNVNFTDLSTGAPTSWKWTFGDGGTSTDKNPAHTYNKTGLYSVTLTVSKTGSSNSVTKSSHIAVSSGFEAPNAAFSASPTLGPVPSTVSFTDQSIGSPTSWKWTFGDGSTSTVKNPVHIYNKTGQFSVTLTASNANGSNTVTKTNYIIISSGLDAPVTNFSASPTSGNIPLTVNFTDNSSGSLTAWKWTFGDGNTSTQQNPAYTYSKAGKFNVALTTSNAAGSNTVTKYSFINVTGSGSVVPNSARMVPSTSFSASSTSGNVPLTINFTDSSPGSPTSWKWTFGDGGTSTDKNPVHIYNKTGQFSVTLTANNANGSNALTKTSYIVVLSGLNAPVTNFSASPTSGSVPLSIGFTDQSIGSPTSWKWTFGDGGTSIDKNPVHTYNKTGQYSVSLTTSNSGGSNALTKSSYIGVVNALDAPNAAFSASPTSGNVPLNIIFADQSTGSPTTWKWLFGDGNTSTVRNPAFTYNKIGKYTVTLTASNAAGSSTMSINSCINVKS